MEDHCWKNFPFEMRESFTLNQGRCHTSTSASGLLTHGLVERMFVATKNPGPHRTGTSNPYLCGRCMPQSRAFQGNPYFSLNTCWRGRGVLFLNIGDKTCLKISLFTKHSGSKSILFLSVFLTFFPNQSHGPTLIFSL